MNQYNPVLLDTNTGKQFYAARNPYDYITTLSYTHEVPYNQWSIMHEMNSTKVLVKILDIFNNEITPNQILIINPNNITITFSTNLAGTAFLYFFG